MAAASTSSKQKKSAEPASPIGLYVKLEDGRPVGEPHRASRSAKWVVDGLVDGTVVELDEEEVPGAAEVVDDRQPGQPGGPTPGPAGE